MTDEVRSPYDLFLELQPKFRDIVLVPQGFGIRLHGGERRMYFYPKFAALGEVGECIHSTMYRGMREGGSSIGDNGNFLQFDIKAGSLPFSFTYDPTSGLDMYKQLDAAAAAAILNGPLSRKFTVGVGDPGILREVLENNKNYSIPIQLLWDGGAEILGMQLPGKLTASSWRFFFPDKSPELNAIAFAIEYAQTQESLKRFPVEQAEAEQLQRSALGNYQTAIRSIARP